MLSKRRRLLSYRRKPVSSDVAVFHNCQSRWIPVQARNDGQRIALSPFLEMMSRIILDRCNNVYVIIIPDYAFLHDLHAYLNSCQAYFDAALFCRFAFCFLVFSLFISSFDSCPDRFSNLLTSSRRARKRLMDWLLSFMHLTSVPVGTCLMYTQVAVLFTFWPPWPDDRMNFSLISFSRISRAFILSRSHIFFSSLTAKVSMFRLSFNNIHTYLAVSVMLEVLSRASMFSLKWIPAFAGMTAKKYRLF